MAVGTTFPNILSTVGNTPLVSLDQFLLTHCGDLTTRPHASVLLKCEFFNRLSSVKDRIGRAMLEEAERSGVITPGQTHIIEPSSGNTGVALAFAAANRGYKLTVVMPDSMSQFRRALLVNSALSAHGDASNFARCDRYLSRCRIVPQKVSLNSAIHYFLQIN